MADEAEMIVRENISMLRESGQNFARSLLLQLDERGTLSERQYAGLASLAEEITAKIARAAEIEARIEIVKDAPKRAPHTFDLSKINDMTADMKRPVLMIRSADGVNFRVSRAGPASRYHGDLMVTSEGATFEDRVWYGRIDSAGRFQPSYNGKVQSYDAVIAALLEFAENPVETAVAYGRATGICCFCNKDLTDERSTSVGYGPVCAKKWGLPWGVSMKCEAA
jgi:Family of unknown function (DUF6011)